jgi:hypothetical protein
MTLRTTDGVNVRDGDSMRGRQRLGVRTDSRMLRALSIALLLALGSAVATGQSSAGVPPLVQPKATAEDVLAAMVRQAASIFAGEVYAIRMPSGMTPGAVASGIASSRPDAVEIEFRVDMAIRGTSIGSNLVLRMPASGWQQGPPPFVLHQRAVNFLRPPDSVGLSGPVQGEGDPPAQPLGVLPIDENNQVDLSRVARLVTEKPPAGSVAPTPQSNNAAGSAPAAPRNVPGVSMQAGQDVLISGLNQGQMPELNGSRVPFLALVRDLTVLSGAEALAGAREQTK